MHKLGLLIAIAAIAVLAIPQASRAQGVFNMGQLTATLSMGGIVQSERQRARRQGHATSGRPRTERVTPPVPVESLRAAFAFTPDPMIRKRIVGRLIAQTRAVDAQAGAEMEMAFAKEDVFGGIHAGLGKFGLDSHNAADATAAYLIAAWYGVRGRDDDPSPAVAFGLRDQITRAMAATPGIRDAKPGIMQDMADAALLSAVVLDAHVKAAKADPSLMPQTKADIAQGARASYGFDLTTMELTERGLQ